jgi:hypothetical protein
MNGKLKLERNGTGTFIDKKLRFPSFNLNLDNDLVSFPKHWTIRNMTLIFI